jgi:hypothetical protein
MTSPTYWRPWSSKIINIINKCNKLLSRVYGIVPFFKGIVSNHIDGFEVGIGNVDPFGVRPTVLLRPYRKPRFHAGYQIEHHVIAGHWFTSPVHGDKEGPSAHYLSSNPRRPQPNVLVVGSFTV